MKLSLLLKDIEYNTNNLPDVDIKDIVYNSKLAKPDTLFVCLTGSVSDGHQFAENAYEAGCRVFMAERELSLPEDATVIILDDTRNALSYISSTFFDYPSKELKIIGITGTKGKTTVTYLTQSVLNNAGISTGVIGTIGVSYGDVQYNTDNTTPESYELQKTFRQMIDAGISCAVIEVSSQAMMTHRVNGIEFEIGVFTNISPDHIGPREHESFENYLECKARLFKQCKLSLINIDDPHAEEIVQAAAGEVITFGLSDNADYYAKDIELISQDDYLGVLFNCIFKENNLKMKTKLPGTFSVYNALSATAIAAELGIDNDTIISAISEAKIRGRSEFISALPFCSVIVDYAHNGVSLRSIMTTLREYNPKRLVVMFGSVGERTQQRRKDMGEVAAELADYTIITADNSGIEDPMSVIKDIAVELEKTGAEFICISDRIEAIKYAIDNARPEDVILLAGKGHEDYQLMGTVKVPFNDAEEARKFGKLRMERETRRNDK